MLAAATWVVKGFDDFTVTKAYAMYITVKFELNVVSGK
jgi:hypothetical protein